MPILKTVKDMIWFKAGTADPTKDNAYLFDGKVSFSKNPVTYEVEKMGTGTGSVKKTITVKDSIDAEIGVTLGFMEPTGAAPGVLPQKELIEAAGLKQDTSVTDKILLYPTMDTTPGVLKYMRGGIMAYKLNDATMQFDLKADVSNSKVTIDAKFNGKYDPAAIANEAPEVGVCADEDVFRVTKNSFVNINGVDVCPFKEISLPMNFEVDKGEDSIVCGKATIDNISPKIEFSQLNTSDGDANLAPIASWLTDADNVVKFTLYSKNYKMTVTANKAKEDAPDDDTSKNSWLQKRSFTLEPDANGRLYEILIEAI